MVERREDLRFAFESRKPFRIAREKVGQDLNRDLATELRVARAIDLAHAAGPEGGENCIWAESSAGGEWQRSPWSIQAGAAAWTGLVLSDADPNPIVAQASDLAEGAGQEQVVKQDATTLTIGSIFKKLTVKHNEPDEQGFVWIAAHPIVEFVGRATTAESNINVLLTQELHFGWREFTLARHRSRPNGYLLRTPTRISP